MPATENLKLLVTATDNASKVLGNVGKAMNTVSDRASKLGKVLSASVVGIGFTKLVSIGQESEMAMARLSGVLSQSGVNFESVKKQIVDVTSALQNKTIYGDEEQKNVIADLTLATGSYQTALSSLPVVLDLAAAAGIDLNTASRMFSQALEGNVEALGRYLPFVRSMKEQGASNAEIMKVLQERTRGAAEKIGEIAPYTKLKNMLGDLAEIIGISLLPVVKGFFEAIKFLGPQVLTTAAGFGVLLKLIFEFGGKSRLVMMGIVGAIGLVVTGFILLWNKFAGFRTFWIVSWTVIKNYFKAIVDVIVNSFKMIISNFQAIVLAFQKPFSIESWKTAINSLKENIIEFGKSTKKDFAEAGTETARVWQENYTKELDKQAKKKLGAEIPKIDVSAIVEKTTEPQKKANEENLKIKKEYEDESYKLGLEYLESTGKQREAEKLKVEEWYNDQYYSAVRTNDDLIMLNEIRAAKLREIDYQYSVSYQNTLEIIRGSLNALTTAIGDSLYALLVEGKNTAEALKEAWLDMAKSILKLITQLIAKIIVFRAIMALFPGGIAFGVPIEKLGFQTLPGTFKRIPGPINEPMPILAHGQEIIGRPSGGIGHSIIVNGDIYGWEESMEKIRNGLYHHSKLTGLPIQFA